MAGDRVASLLVRAAACGALDFTRHDPFDTWWWRKARWITAELERQARAQVLQAQLQHWLVAYQEHRQPEEAQQRQQSWDVALEILEQFTKNQLPWVSLEAPTDPVADIIAAYREEFGYPGEARYEKMLQELSAALDSIGQDKEVKPELS